MADPASKDDVRNMVTKASEDMMRVVQPFVQTTDKRLYRLEERIERIEYTLNRLADAFTAMTRPPR